MVYMMSSAEFPPFFFVIELFTRKSIIKFLNHSIQMQFNGDF